MANDRTGHLRRMGFSQERYNLALENQNGKCAMCGTTDPGWGHKNFVIDHDHACCPQVMRCGTCFRGLLCMTCNIGLGHYEKFKLAAEEYLAGRNTN